MLFRLYEAVAPLNVLGNVVGYLMMGQSIDGSPGSREQLIENARRLSPMRNCSQQPPNRCACAARIRFVVHENTDVCAQYITLSNRFQINKSHISTKSGIP